MRYYRHPIKKGRAMEKLTGGTPSSISTPDSLEDRQTKRLRGVQNEDPDEMNKHGQ